MHPPPEAEQKSIITPMENTLTPLTRIKSRGVRQYRFVPIISLVCAGDVLYCNVSVEIAIFGEGPVHISIAPYVLVLRSIR